MVGACGQGSRGTRVLRSADAHPDGYPTVGAVRAFADALETRSEGRLRLKLFPGGQLGQEADTLEITIFGGLDVNRVNIAPLQAFAPETRVPSLPFLFRSTAHMRAALDGTPGQAILRALEPHGLIGLCFYDSGTRSFYTTGSPILTPDDLAGRKIRVQNSDLYVAMVQALGGNATPMAYGEVYQALTQGVVDGAENNWASYESSRHFEVARYYSLTRHVMAPEVLVMSAKRWKRLAQADRDLVLACARDSVPVMRSLWDAREAEAETRLRAAGVEVFEPDLSPFRERVAPVWDRFLSTPALRALADAIMAMEAANA
jgi:tripartite ATP-independent transporter DctP family solute receptor